MSCLAMPWQWHGQAGVVRSGKNRQRMVSCGRRALARSGSEGLGRARSGDFGCVGRETEPIEDERYKNKMNKNSDVLLPHGSFKSTINKLNIITDPLQRVGELISDLGQMEAASQHTKAQIGYLLTDISEKELWRGQYESFRDYMLNLEALYNQSYSSLYSYFYTARELKPFINEDQFDRIGISKAQELVKIKRNGVLNPSIFELAMDPSTSREDVFKAAAAPNSTVLDDDREWYDFSLKGYASPEEVLVLESAFQAAWDTDPVAEETWPEGKRNLDGLLKMAMEYLNTYKTNEFN